MRLVLILGLVLWALGMVAPTDGNVDLEDLGWFALGGGAAMVGLGLGMRL
jgi:hypothetical protein